MSDTIKVELSLPQAKLIVLMATLDPGALGLSGAQQRTAGSLVGRLSHEIERIEKMKAFRL